MINRDKQIVDAYKRLKSTRKTAQAVKVSHSTVQRTLVRLGINRRPKNKVITEDDKQQVRKLLAKGVSKNQIYRQTNISVGSINKIIGESK